MADTKPPVSAELVWLEELRFGATIGSSALVVDGKSAEGPSPVQLLVTGLAGCMAIDVVDIITKGRHKLTGLRAMITAERAQDPPRRVTRATIHFHIHGDVPAAAAERAIALSHDKYCSVWHSMRQDIELSTTFEILP